MNKEQPPTKFFFVNPIIKIPQSLKKTYKKTTPLTLIVLLIGLAGGIFLLREAVLTYQGSASEHKLVSKPSVSVEVGSWVDGQGNPTTIEAIKPRIRATGSIEIGGAFCFSKYLRSGAQCISNIWASTDFHGKDPKQIVARPVIPVWPTPQPGGSPFGKTPACPVQLVPFPGYPAECNPPLRQLSPAITWLENNEAVLADSTHEAHRERFQPHDFLLVGNISVEDLLNPDKCVIYLHLRDNRKEQGTPFFAFNFCEPTGTPPPTPTITPTPTPIMKCPSIVGPYESQSACEELCLSDVGYDSLTYYNSYSPALSGGKVICKPGPDNSASAYLGSWYCCPGANCGQNCITDEDCGEPLKCLPPPDESIQINSCQDFQDCSLWEACWCTLSDKVYDSVPTVTPKPTEAVQRCEWLDDGYRECSLFCESCHPDKYCSEQCDPKDPYSCRYGRNCTPPIQ